MKKKVLSLVLALSMVGASLAGCGSSNDTAAADTKTDAAAEETADAAATTEETKEITIAVPDPEASYIYQAAQEFANRAEEYSGGSLKFTISGNGSLYGGDTAAVGLPEQRRRTGTDEPCIFYGYQDCWKLDPFLP